MHWLLSGLKEQKVLHIYNWVSPKLIELNLPIILSELYGELNEAKTNEQDNLIKLIKEAKTRKAIPICEFFAESLDFNTTFPSLVSPIIKILSTSPSPAKIM